MVSCGTSHIQLFKINVTETNWIYWWIYIYIYYKKPGYCVFKTQFISAIIKILPVSLMTMLSLLVMVKIHTFFI